MKFERLAHPFGPHDHPAVADVPVQDIPRSVLL